MKRRSFLQNTSIAGAGLTFSKQFHIAYPVQDSRIEVFVDDPIGRIAPEIYGHFSEHIGGVIYDGIWVGPDSKIPNTEGFRQDIIDHMRQINPGNLRWPGGCFADSYNWKDGIGPRASRPRRANFWINTPFLKKAPDGPSKYEPNHFGTDEFLRFCELIETSPYLAANARTLPAQDMIDWIEYCNAPPGTTTYGDMRVANGKKEPYNVAFWGVGNESWGCGGDMTPEHYANLFRQFTSFIPEFDTELKLVAVGPSDNYHTRDLNWTRRLFTKLAEPSNTWTYIPDRIAGYSLHFYCGTTGTSSIDFSDEDWYELIWRSDQMEKVITEHWEALGAFDLDRRIKLYIDEWGAWHAQKTEVHNTHLFGQTSTMRDAMIAALSLDTFNRHADKVAVANIAQLVNNLQSLFLAHEDRFVVTPNFYVFDMYKQHQNKQSLRTKFSSPYSSNIKSLWGLQGSASIEGKQLFLTAVNPSITETRETEIIIHGAKIKSGRVTTFQDNNIRNYNNLDNPSNIKLPQQSNLHVQNGTTVHLFKNASVTSMEIELE